jgi:hypothetical protein
MRVAAQLVAPRLTVNLWLTRLHFSQPLAHPPVDRSSLPHLPSQDPPFQKELQLTAHQPLGEGPRLPVLSADPIAWEQTGLLFWNCILMVGSRLGAAAGR